MNSAPRGLRPTVGLRRPGRCLLRRRRPTPGAERPGRPISIGVKAFGQQSACADREGVFCVGEGRRPARERLRRPISIGAKAFGRRSACADREDVFCVGGGRRPARERPGRPISIGVEAFGRRSACADRGGVFCVGEGRRLARSALEGRFQSVGAALAATIAGSRRQGLRIEGSSFRNDGRYHRGTGSGRKPLLHKATTVRSRRQGLRCGKPFPQK